MIYAQVLGLEEGRHLARRLKNAPRASRQAVARSLAADLRKQAPRRTGRLRRGVKGVVHGDNIVVGVFGVPYARARSEGAYIVARGAPQRFQPRNRDQNPEGKKALHWRGARHPVKKGIRQRPNPYFKKALLNRARIIERELVRELEQASRV